MIKMFIRVTRTRTFISIELGNMTCFREDSGTRHALVRSSVLHFYFFTYFFLGLASLAPLGSQMKTSSRVIDNRDMLRYVLVDVDCINRLLLALHITFDLSFDNPEDLIQGIRSKEPQVLMPSCLISHCSNQVIHCNFIHRPCNISLGWLSQWIKYISRHDSPHGL